MKIQDQLIKSIISLQSRHKAIVDKLNHIYALLEVTSKHLNNYKEELSNIGDDNIKNKQKLYDVLIKYETEILKLNSDTKPYLDELELLKKESTNLYLKIIELFPNTDEEEIKSILADNIDNYKEVNNID